MRCQFTGTSLTVNLATPTRTYQTEVEWRIDGGAWQRSTISSSLSLASGLSAGTHTCELLLAGNHYADNRWTDDDGLSITSFTVDTAATVSEWPTGNTRRILVIGDSISEGNLVLGYSGSGEPNRPVYSSGRLAYPYLLGQSVYADVSVFAFGGAHVSTTSDDGDIPALDDAYPYVTSGVSATDPDFDVVLVAAGHNDGSATEIDFKADYGNLLDQVIADNPSATVFCLEPIAPWASAVSPWIATVAATKGATFIDTTAWTVSKPNLNHPDTTGQASMAAYLAPIITPSLPGLTITPTANWTQSGTTLTVTAPRLVHTVCQATINSENGGEVRFNGAHTSRFDVSLDGVTYTATVEVGAGTTEVWLGVTPEAGDTSLTAQVGVWL